MQYSGSRFDPDWKHRRDGTGIAVDQRVAVKWHTRAAKAGNASAQYNLIICYTDDTGIIAVDLREAVKW